MDSQLLKNQIANIVQGVLLNAGFTTRIAVNELQETQKKIFIASVESDQDLSLLIGKNGQNLSALEHVIRLIAIRSDDIFKEVNLIVDIDDYRKSRANYLIKLAQDTVQRVLHTGRAEALVPMSAYERRLVHTELASYTEVQTESIGEDPCRRIVIKPEL